MTYRVVRGGTGLTGHPRVDLNLELTGGDLPGSDATAARAVNAISTVCQAPLASAARSTSSSSRPE